MDIALMDPALMQSQSTFPAALFGSGLVIGQSESKNLTRTTKSRKLLPGKY
jgi:hypothetical protein